MSRITETADPDLITRRWDSDNFQGFPVPNIKISPCWRSFSFSGSWDKYSTWEDICWWFDLEDESRRQIQQQELDFRDLIGIMRSERQKSSLPQLLLDIFSQWISIGTDSVANCLFNWHPINSSSPSDPWHWKSGSVASVIKLSSSQSHLLW